jgi:hypothetical protein
MPLAPFLTPEPQLATRFKLLPGAPLKYLVSPLLVFLLVQKF